MQPEVSQTPITGSEHVPLSPAQGAERVPSLPPLAAGIERGADRREQLAEASAGVADAAAIGATVSSAAPVSTIAAAQPTPPAAVPAAPLAAADEDVIEKAWVDKAKAILASTKDDPHARTSQVNQLQREYLKKRFGKVIGGGE